MHKIINRLKMFLVPEAKNDYLPQILRARPLFWYGVVILGLKIAVICLILFFPATDFFAAISSQRLLALINGVRQEKGLASLALNSQLTTAANLKATDMTANNYFEHTSPQGIAPWDWFRIVGYNFSWAGENLAMDFFESDAVFAAWMNSSSHRGNILNPNFREIGIAVKNGEIQERQTTFAVLVFGTPVPIKKLAPPATSPASSNLAPQKSSVPAKTLIPSATPAASVLPTPQPAVLPAPAKTEIVLKSALSEISPAPKISASPQIELADTSLIISPPHILGAFTSKIDETTKSLYLYTALFLITALAINILVKINIQHWGTIITTAFLIFLSGLLIFI